MHLKDTVGVTDSKPSLVITLTYSETSSTPDRDNPVESGNEPIAMEEM
jgi:hypothetical protein